MAELSSRMSSAEFIEWMAEIQLQAIDHAQAQAAANQRSRM